MSGRPEQASLDHLLGWAALVEARVRALVTEARAGDPAPDDPFRGLYLGDEAVDRLLRDGQHLGDGWHRGDQRSPGGGDGTPDSRARAALAERAGRAEAAGYVVRLARLARDAGLTPLDVELLVVALLPDLDPRVERLYGYLNDDVTRRRASVGLALRLAGASALAAADRARLAADRPLVRHGLLRVEDADRPLLGRALRVPDRVGAHLLGDDAPDPALTGLLVDARPYASPRSAELAAALTAGVGLVHLRERLAGSGTATAVAALAATGRGAVVLDLGRLAGAPDPQPLVALAVREALLTGAGLVAGPVEELAGSHPGVVRALGAAPVPVLLGGTATWDPRWSSRSPLGLDAPVLGAADRVALWRRELDEDGPDGVVVPSGADGTVLPDAAEDRGLPDDRDGGHAVELAGHLSLGPEQVRRAVEAARVSARLRDGVLSADDLRRGVRAQNAAGLERLARRIEPEVGWSDLVLTPAVLRGLRDLTARARHRDTVLSQWRMRRGGGRGRGVTALFAGDSGTGKTMSAEVIAADLQLDLYTVNLATVVDKYIGETEKNLERIFAEAGGVNAVLFFDEADAIFGKRSDVKDAHDRYANIESAYLLQRLETFDGLAVLATNLRANIDDAFTRRLDAILDFPPPTPELRRSLWERCLAPPLPVADDLDLDFLASAFELAGGNIRSASTTAAYLAAADGGPVTMAQVISAVEQEYRKLGRLVLEREFGRYYPAVR